MYRTVILSYFRYVFRIVRDLWQTVGPVVGKLIRLTRNLHMLSKYKMRNCTQFWLRLKSHMTIEIKHVCKNEKNSDYLLTRKKNIIKILSTVKYNWITNLECFTCLRYTRHNNKCIYYSRKYFIQLM